MLQLHSQGNPVSAPVQTPSIPRLSGIEGRRPPSLPRSCRSRRLTGPSGRGTIAVWAAASDGIGPRISGTVRSVAAAEIDNG